MAGIVSIALALVGVVLLLGDGSSLESFVAAALCPDGHLSPSGCHTVVLVTAFGAFCALALGALLCWCAQPARRQALWRAVTRDSLRDLAPVWPSGTAAFALPVAASIVLMGLYYAMDHTTEPYLSIFHEDGITEWATALSYLLACIMLALYLRHGAATLPKGPARTVVLVSGAAMLMGMVFVLGEELSWGQRIFGWETPEAFATNCQGEINLHNLKRTFLAYPERLLAAFPVFVLPPLLVRRSSPLRETVLRLFPHPSLIPFTMLIATASWFDWFHLEELLETMLAIWVLLYAARLWRTTRQPRAT